MGVSRICQNACHLAFIKCQFHNFPNSSTGHRRTGSCRRCRTARRWGCRPQRTARCAPSATSCATPASTRAASTSPTPSATSCTRCVPSHKRRLVSLSALAVPPSTLRPPHAFRHFLHNVRSESPVFYPHPSAPVWTLHAQCSGVCTKLGSKMRRPLFCPMPSGGQSCTGCPSHCSGRYLDELACPGLWN